ncbi:uncharacterized protein LOC142419721 [Mycteria americana]|uniref:uncharacterized protein LOC142419721 n=1 Tax=Mycteria americana TaxID=33587 RepID=UPI003F585D51
MQPLRMQSLRVQTLRVQPLCCAPSEPRTGHPSPPPSPLRRPHRHGGTRPQSPSSVGATDLPAAGARGWRRWVGHAARRCAVSGSQPRRPGAKFLRPHRKPSARSALALHRGQAGPEGCRSEKGLEERNQVSPEPPASPWQAAAGSFEEAGVMFFIIIIIFIAITFLIMIFHVCRKLCHDPAPPPPYRDAQGPVPPPPYRDPQGPVPPPLAPMPALPSLPGGAIPVGLEPPRYSEVTAKPFLYPVPPGPCPECGRGPGAQPLFATQTSF